MNLRAGPYLQVPLDQGFRYTLIYVSHDGKVAGPADLSEAAAYHLNTLGVPFTPEGLPPWKAPRRGKRSIQVGEVPVLLSAKARRLVEGKPLARDFKEGR